MGCSQEYLVAFIVPNGSNAIWTKSEWRPRFLLVSKRVLIWDSIGNFSIMIPCTKFMTKGRAKLDIKAFAVNAKVFMMLYLTEMC